MYIYTIGSPAEEYGFVSWYNTRRTPYTLLFRLSSCAGGEGWSGQGRRQVHIVVRGAVNVMWVMNPNLNGTDGIMWSGIEHRLSWNKYST